MSNASQARFQSTRWSLVVAAGEEPSSDTNDALEELCKTYWYPLYAYARRRGKTAQQAEDVTQAFFARVFEKNYLRSADPERGRFRSYLLTMFKRFMSTEAERSNAAKRGGTANHLSLDFESGEQRYSLEPIDEWTAERLFDRRWALTLLDRVLEQLRQVHVDRGSGELFDHAHVFLTANTDEQRYADVAEKLGISAGTLRVSVHRMRQQYRDMLIAEVAQTLDNPSEADQELECLRAAIRGNG